VVHWNALQGCPRRYVNRRDFVAVHVQKLPVRARRQQFASEVAITSFVPVSITLTLGSQGGLRRYKPLWSLHSCCFQWECVARVEQNNSHPSLGISRVTVSTAVEWYSDTPNSLPAGRLLHCTSFNNSGLELIASFDLAMTSSMAASLCFL